MKKNKLLLICVIVLFGTSLLQAQNTGYMGKRVIFNMGTSFSPAWVNPSSLNEDPKKLVWHAFNYTLLPNIEVIAWRLGTVGANYHFFKTKYFYHYLVKTTDDNNYYSDTYANRIQLEDLTSHGVGLFYKQYFGSRSRAPMGTFIKFQLDGFFFKHPISYTDQTMKNSSLFGCKIEFGHDFLFFNRLRFSTGISLGSTFGGYKTLLEDKNSSENWFILFDDVEPIESYAKNRILGHYWLGFTVNIGFLAF